MRGTDVKSEMVGVAYAVAAGVAVALVAALIQLPNRDVKFCRRVFSALARGHQAIQQDIAWERLQALDVNVGEVYRQVAGADQQRDYRRAFIEQFAQGFRQGGGTLDAFRGWRVHSRAGESAVVAADYPAKQKTLLLSVSGGWRKQLTGMQWR